MNLISRYTFCICACLLSFGMLGQDGYVNSLRAEAAGLDTASPDTTHYKVYLELVSYFINKNPDSSIHYLEKCLNVSSQLGYKPGYEKATFNLAQQYKYKGDYDKAREYIDVCLESSPSNYMYARAVMLLGDIQRNQSEYSYAMDSYRLADSLGSVMNDSLFLGNLYNSMAIYYDLDHDYENAITYHLKSAEISKSFRDTNGYATSMRNIAVIYNDIKEFDKAKDYIKEAKENLFEDNPRTAMHIMQTEAVAFAGLNDVSGAISAYEASNDIAKIYGANQIASVNMYNMASLYLSRNNFVACSALIEKGLKLTELEEKRFRFLVLRATLNLAQNNCAAAQATLDEAEAYTHLVKDFYIKREFYKCLAELTACFGDHKKTGTYIDSSEIFFDSTYYNKKETEFRRLEAKYQNKVARDSINILKLKNSLQKNQINNQRYQKLGAFLLFLLGLALALLYRKYYNAQKELNTALNAEKESLLFKTEELIEINKALEAEQHQKTKQKVSEPPPSKVELRVGEKIQFVETDQVMYLLAEDNGTRIYLTDRSIWVPLPLKEVHGLFNLSNFIQVFRSTVINTDYIQFLENKGVEMHDGIVLKISRKYRDEVVNRFKQ